jgi:hypothetical protein
MPELRAAVSLGFVFQPGQECSDDLVKFHHFSIDHRPLPHYRRTQNAFKASHQPARLPRQKTLGRFAAEESLIIFPGKEHCTWNGILAIFDRDQENVVLISYCETGIGGAEIYAAKNRIYHHLENWGRNFHLFDGQSKLKKIHLNCCEDFYLILNAAGGLEKVLSKKCFHE